MKISFAAKLGSSDLWVLPFWQGGKAAAELPIKIQGALHDFKGKNGETLLYYSEEQRVLLLGLGPKESASIEMLRRAYAAAVKLAKSKKLKKIEILFPDCKQKEEFFRGIAEGIFLTNYSFTYKKETIKEDPIVLLDSVQFVGAPKTAILDEILPVVEGVHFVRDLVNANADEKLNLVLEKAKKLHPKIKTSIYDKKWIEKQGMGLLLAVGRGSHVDPHFVQLEYKGDTKSKKQVVLIGKGVLYDTGGLSIKPTDGMVSMKCDMAGAATVMGVIKVAAELNLKVNVTVLMPLTENSIDGKSYKLGDVYTSYLGKTVEITNTDAEGRLILADAIAYAQKNLAPSVMVDLATLTGACVVALEDDIGGLFSSDDELADRLLQASDHTDELLWRLPMHTDYFENYKSDIADMINSGSREGSSIKAALFLKQFAGDVPFAHLDIAGPAYVLKPKHYSPLKGTGYAVRLLTQFLKDFKS